MIYFRGSVKKSAVWSLEFAELLPLKEVIRNSLSGEWIHTQKVKDSGSDLQNCPVVHLRTAPRRKYSFHSADSVRWRIYGTTGKEER